MKPALVFAMLAFLPAALFSAAPADSFISKYVEADQQTSYSGIFTNSGKYFIMKLDGLETFLMDNITGQPVEGSVTMERLLREDVYARAEFENKKAGLLSTIREFNTTKYENERKCRQYTGTDTHQCKDRESCVVACFAVPVCTTIINADGFWQSVYNWSESTYRLDSVASQFEPGIGGIAQGGAVIDSQIAKLDEMIFIARANWENSLFKNRSFPECVGLGAARCFDFCPRIEYSISKLQSARSTLVVLKTQLSALSLQQARAGKIIERGDAQKKYVEGRGAMLAQHRIFVVGAVFNASEAFGEANKTLNDSQLRVLMWQLAEKTNESEMFEKDEMYKLEFATAMEIGSLSERVVNRSKQIISQREKIESDLGSAGLKIAKAAEVGANGTVVRGLNFTYSRLARKIGGKLDTAELPGIASEVGALGGEAGRAVVDALLANQSARGAGGDNESTTLQIQIPRELKCQLPIALASIAIIGAFASVRRK